MHAPERFTDQAQSAISLAEQEARRRKHAYVGTEHVLVAMLLVPDGLAGQVLTNIGVSISKVIEDLETTLSRNQRIDLKSIMPTSRVKEVIEIASREAARSGSDKIHTTHLVLAILVEGKGIAALILDQNGATTDLVRAQCEKL